MSEKSTFLLKLLLPVLIALLSFFLVAGRVSSPDFYQKTIHSLDEKKTTVMELTAASTAASAAITLLPGDTATPIAEKIADLSSYFLIVLCAIFVEKYMLTIIGFVSFKILLPAACLLLSFSLWRKRENIRQFAYKLGIFALLIPLVIPSSVKIADMIDETYHTSIQKTISSAKEVTEDIQAEADQSAGTSSEEDSDSTAKKESKGILSGLVSKVTDSVSDLTDRVKTSLSNFIEAIAVMIVTSCLIPLIVLWFFLWLIKTIFKSGFQLSSIN